MRTDILAALRAAAAEARPVALLTRLPDGAQHLWTEAADPPPADLPPALADAARAALDADRATIVTVPAEGGVDGATWFVHPHNPPLRLILVGAVHIAQALVPMAAAAGFAVTVVDPRRAFNTAERFPAAAALRDAWPDEALLALRPDRRTAVVTLTHDPKLDDPALDAALRTDAFYLGALGSRRTHAKRLARLGELGHGPEATARIHAPVGLDIAAVSAPEIALSILAEVVAVRRGAPLAARVAAAAADPLAVAPTVAGTLG